MEPAKPATAALEVKDGDADAIFTGKSFTLRFDKKEGVIEQYRYQGVTLLERGPRPDFWRAPTNNDRGAWKVAQARAQTDPSLNIELWREAGPRWAGEADTGGETGRRNRARHRPRGFAGGRRNLYHHLYYFRRRRHSGGMPVPARCGEALDDAAFRKRTGGGRGSGKTSPGTDAAPGRPRSIASSSASASIGAPWIGNGWSICAPRRTANKTDVRWVKLTNAQGLGLMASGAPTLNVTARHFTKDDLERAAYTFQMQRHPEIYLNLDWKQMGAGGIDSWTENAYPMAPYRIAGTEEHSYSYRLRPVSPPAKQ